MKLVAEVARELSHSAGLREQPDWAPTIAAALAKYAPGAASAQGLNAEDRRFLLSEIARHVTVPESYFFRNLAQLAFCAEHAHQVRIQSGRRARLWCAGSATGEEPYSIAMLLHRRLEANLAESVELFASDLNPEAVEKARQAVYTSWSFRGAPSWCFRFFSADSGARLRLSQDDVRELVSFRVESCQAGATNQPAQSLDVVMFRNVAIYMEEAAIQALYSEFARILKPGGLLGLGPSDPRPIGGAFVLLGHYDHAPVFARALPSETGAAPPRAAAARPVPPRVLASFFGEPSEPREPLGTSKASEPPAARAVEVVQTLAHDAPLDSTAQRLLGLAHLERDETAEAVSALRQAVFLDATDVVSRYFYALALYENREPVRATRQLENVIEALAGRPPDETLADGSTTARELLQSATFLGTQWK